MEKTASSISGAEKTRKLNVKEWVRDSLVAQWLRVHLLMEGTRVRALVWEDPYMPRSGWACEPWSLSLCEQSVCSATGEATTVRRKLTSSLVPFQYIKLYTQYFKWDLELYCIHSVSCLFRLTSNHLYI